MVIPQQQARANPVGIAILTNAQDEVRSDIFDLADNAWANRTRVDEIFSSSPTVWDGSKRYLPGLDPYLAKRRAIPAVGPWRFYPKKKTGVFAELLREYQECVASA